MRHTWKKVLGALVVALPLLCGGLSPARAVTLPLVPFTTNPLDALLAGDVYDSFLLHHGTGGFSDDYYFSLASPPVSATTITTTLGLHPNGSGLGIANLIATWFNPDGTTLASQQFTDGLGNYNFLVVDGFSQFFSVGALGIPGDRYILHVTGTALAPSGGDYDLAVSVPGPTVGTGLAGLFAGLSLLMLARRRRAMA
jgi:hypothetical protein